MIDAAVRILEMLIELFEQKGRRRELYFREFVEPLFKDAEEVAKDYIGLFKDLIDKLEHEDNIPNIIEWIEQRRGFFLPLRIKLRGALKAYFPDTANMDKFQHGLWWLLRGGLTFIEEGHALLIDDKVWGDHTVLDLLYFWSQEPLYAHRDRYVSNARRQLECIEKAWSEISEGYAQLKKKAIR